MELSTRDSVAFVHSVYAPTALPESSPWTTTTGVVLVESRAGTAFEVSSAARATTSWVTHAMTGDSSRVPSVTCFTPQRWTS